VWPPRSTPRADDAAECSRSIRVGDARARLEEIRGRIGVTRLGDTTSLDVLGICTAVAIRRDVVEPGITVASGKGRTVADARLTALAESYERYCAEPRGRIPTFRGGYSDLRTAIDPRSLVPAWWSRYSPEQSLEWCIGVALDDGHECAVPANAVFFPYEPPPLEQLFSSHTTGLSCGGAMEDALCSGLLECIERDHYTRVVAQLSSGCAVDSFEIDVATLPPSDASEVKRLRATGTSVVLRDITGDFGIPTVLALIARDSQVHRGCAAHPRSNVAARAALFEAAQGRATDIQGAREDLLPFDGVAPHRWFTEPLAVGGLRNSVLVVDDIGAEVRFLARRMKEVLGEAPVAVDLSLDGAGVPAIRIVAPGLEFWAEDEDRIGPRCRAWMDG